MQFIKPEKKYLNSYYEACVETWGHVHDNYIIHNPNEFDKWKNNIFENYDNSAKGINLPEDFVPSETFWIIENNEYIGTINIRKTLNKRLQEYGGHAGVFVRLKYRNRGYGNKIGELSLKKMYQMGIDTILLTCEETNIISQKILEKLKPVKTEKESVLLNGKITAIRRYYFKNTD